MKSMQNPLVSYCLVTYNQEEFVREAIESAFNQAYDNLEIIISDDCSTDNTVSIIEKMVREYNGPHKIIVNKNEKNLGIREHFNKIWYQIAKGDFIVLAGGDDVSESMRVKEYMDYFIRFPEVTSISCKSMQMDRNMRPLYDNDEWDNSYSIFTLGDYIGFSDFFNLSGDSRGFRREVIDKFEPLQYARSEDITTFVRSLLIGSALYIRKPLVKRRKHDNNASKSLSSTHEELRKQIYTDINSAMQKQYISKNQFVAMKKKIDYMIETFDLYQTPLSVTKPKAFIYRVLAKVFKVRKVEQ